jgi:hypothetical protein
MVRVEDDTGETEAGGIDFAAMPTPFIITGSALAFRQHDPRVGITRGSCWSSLEQTVER